jgi:hypothetical protein
MCAGKRQFKYSGNGGSYTSWSNSQNHRAWKCDPCESLRQMPFALLGAQICTEETLQPIHSMRSSIQRSIGTDALMWKTAGISLPLK